MNRDTPLRRVTEFPFSKIEDRILVVVGKTREVHLLNESAARIWELLETPTTLNGVIDALVEEYEVAPDTVAAEVETAVAEMVEKGLVRST